MIRSSEGCRQVFWSDGVASVALLLNVIYMYYIHATSYYLESHLVY
jgi:hypothetical protein